MGFIFQERKARRINMKQGTEKTKVLHLVESFGGGVYTIVKAITESTCEEFDVTLAFAWRPETPRDFMKKMNPNVHLIPLENFEREINPLKDMKALAEAKRLIKSIQPDILHLHSSKAGIIGRVAVNCKNIPVMYTPHGYSFQKKDDSFWKCMVYKYIEKIAAKMCGITVACSKGEWLTAKTITNKATYVNNGINIEHLPVKKVSPKTKYRFCTIGRICMQKNPSMFNQIAQAFPEEEFIWIGDGELSNLITSDNITITGWKEPKKATELLAQQDIFLLPSLWEGLSVALLEAMYLKCICIASRIPGIREVIEHGVNGFLAEKPEDYIQIIREILDGVYDLESIAERAHQDVIENYTLNVMCSGYKRLYKELGEKSERFD